MEAQSFDQNCFKKKQKYTFLGLIHTTLCPTNLYHSLIKILLPLFCLNWSNLFTSLLLLILKIGRALLRLHAVLQSSCLSFPKTSQLNAAVPSWSAV